MVLSNDSPVARVSFDPQAAFTAFIDRIPTPSGSPLTPETVVWLKEKGAELRDKLTALGRLKGTWTKDQLTGYYLADFQRKLVFCRVLRVNRLVSTPTIVAWNSHL